MNTYPAGANEAYWLHALEFGSPREVSHAALRLGRQMLALGERHEGLVLLRRAADGGDPETAPRAAWALAEVHWAAGRSKQANADFSRAVALASAQWTPELVLALAARYAAYGQVAAAVDLYEQLIREAEPRAKEVAALAAYRLAHLFLEQGSIGKAKRSLRQALRDGSEDLKCHAMSDLADVLSDGLLSEEEFVQAPADVAAEQEALRECIKTFHLRVIETDHPDLAPRSAFHLAMLIKEEDRIGAEERLRAVVLSEHPIYASLADEKLDELTRIDGTLIADHFLQELREEDQLNLDELMPFAGVSHHLRLPSCKAYDHWDVWRRSERDEDWLVARRSLEGESPNSSPLFVSFKFRGCPNALDEQFMREMHGLLALLMDQGSLRAHTPSDAVLRVQIPALDDAYRTKVVLRAPKSDALSRHVYTACLVGQVESILGSHGISRELLHETLMEGRAVNGPETLPSSLVTVVRRGDR